MKLFNKSALQNLSVVFISVGGAAVCGFLLYRDMYLQKASVNGHLPAGHLADKHQTVKRKLGDNLIWDLINSHETLYWNDSIQTAEKSGASIVLDSGSQITLGESSLVVLEKDNDQLNLDLKSGQLIVASDDKAGMQSIRVNGAMVEQKAGQQLAVQMDSAKHVVTATTTSADGTSKQMTVDDKGHVEEKITPVTLNSPAGLSHLSSEQNETKVTFKWQSPSEKKKVIQIAADRDFIKTVAEKEIDGNSYDASLPSGNYYWRIKVPDGQKTSLSETRSFDVVKATAPPESSLSGPGHVVYTTVAPILEFSWAPDPGASKYVFEAAQDANFKNLALKAEVTDNSLRTSDLKAGHLYWRVSSVFGEIVKTSAAKEFNLEKQAVAPATDLVPEKDFKVTYDYFDKFKGIPFRWKSQAREAYRFVFSKKSDLRDEMVGFETTQEETLVKDNLTPGIYYWAVGSRDAEGKWAYNEIHKIEVGILVAPPSTPMAMGPADTGDLDLLKNPTLKWAWKEVSGAKEYHFKLVRVDGEKEDVVLEDKIKGLAKEKNDLPDGKYRWLVSTLDSFGRESKPVTHEFNVTHGKSLEAPAFEMSEVQ